MDTIKINRGNVKMVAHRGLSGLERENTCSAFVAASQRSYAGIETDVHVTSDGKFIIIHDDSTERVCDKALPVEQSTLEELRALKVKNTDDKCSRGDLVLPLLSEYAAICKKYSKTAVLEIKNLMSRENVLKVVEIMREYGDIDNTIFISFAFDNLKFIKEEYPELACQYLVGEFNDEVLDNMKKYSIGLDIYFGNLTKEIVDICHENGLQVNCWTVDHPDDGQRMVDMGVDFITSNILE